VHRLLLLERCVGAGRLRRRAHRALVAGCSCWACSFVDGINGVWDQPSHPARRSHRVLASRVMACTVAAVSLAVGGFTVAKLLLPAVDAWATGAKMLLGAIGRDGGADRVRRRHARSRPLRLGRGGADRQRRPLHPALGERRREHARLAASAAP